LPAGTGGGNVCRVQRPWWPWIWFLLGAGLATRSLLAHATDFDIYLQAARELTGGGPDLYRPHATHGSFPYPHWVLLPLRALWFLPADALRVLYGASLGWATAWLAGDLQRLAAIHGPMPVWRWALLVALLGRTVTSNYTNAQLSLWVAALTLRGLRRIGDGAELRGGACLGAAVAMKLTPGLFWLVLPFAGRWRAAAASVATAGLLALLLPIPFLGLAEHTRHLRAFEAAMLQPLREGGGDQAVWQSSSASVRGTLEFLLQAPAPGETERVHVADLGEATVGWIVRLWSLLLVGIGIAGLWRARGDPPAQRWLRLASITVLWIALLAPLTRSYHLAPALLPGLLFCQLGPGRRPLAIGLWLLTAALLSSALLLRQRSLLGETLWRGLDQVGVLHLGLVGLLLWISFYACKIAAEPDAPR
jgi:hypothetical protein